jgi:hypothetical protein
MTPLTEQERAILARHEAGASRGEIAAEFGLSRAQVRRVTEWKGHINAKGRELLSADPESLKGLRATGALSARAYSALANATYAVDVPDLARVSDVAAQGRECVACFQGTGGAGSKTMAELDALLARFGLTWNPRPRPFAWRTDENLHPSIAQMREQQAEQKRQAAQDSRIDNNAFYQIGRLQGAAHVIENELGLPHPPEHYGRQAGESGESYYGRMVDDLRSRIRSLEKIAFSSSARCIDDEDGPADDLARSGNLVCLPGIKLADVLGSDDGGRP